MYHNRRVKVLRLSAGGLGCASSAGGASSLYDTNFPDAAGGDRGHWSGTHNREPLSGKGGPAAQAGGIGAARLPNLESAGLSDTAPRLGPAFGGHRSHAMLACSSPQRAPLLRGAAIWFAVSGTLFAVTFASQRLLDALLLTRLQIEGVSLDILDDVFLEDLSLKAFECTLQAFAIVKLNFCQRNSPRFLVVVSG